MVFLVPSSRFVKEGADILITGEYPVLKPLEASGEVGVALVKRLEVALGIVEDAWCALAGFIRLIIKD